MSLKDKVKQIQGFSLVEMIVVIAILGIVVMAAMGLFIPAKRASVSQSQLVDVQSNLRLALDRLTKDIRNAGFLYFDNDAVTSPDTSHLVIKTLSAVSGQFGKIVTYGGDYTLTLLTEDQAGLFGVGDYVAIVHPLSGDVLGDAYYLVDDVDATNKAVTIKNLDGSGLIPDQKNALNGTFNAPNNVLLKSRNLDISGMSQVDQNSSLVRTITYALEDGTLTREVSPPLVPGGPTKQYLARNLSDLQFNLTKDVDDDVIEVTISVEGKTEKVGNDVVGSVKTRRFRTVVALRNI